MKIITNLKFGVLVIPFTILAIVRARRAASHLLMIATTQRVKTRSVEAEASPRQAVQLQAETGTGAVALTRSFA